MKVALMYDVTKANLEIRYFPSKLARLGFGSDVERFDSKSNEWLPMDHGIYRTVEHMERNGSFELVGWL